MKQFFLLLLITIVFHIIGCDNASDQSSNSSDLSSTDSRIVMDRKDFGIKPSQLGDFRLPQFIETSIMSSKTGLISRNQWDMKFSHVLIGRCSSSKISDEIVRIYNDNHPEEFLMISKADVERTEYNLLLLTNKIRLSEINVLLREK